ncbi:2-oxo-4-hydroxy-4-carboxy-5-ureidoimidazoline decarboxylase [Hymenobacter bucti]|uniref:2-oxo-4-hydroxy-4-carboxy-5-ureidoimidazoline decarboxylase n=1 Tax=Hymenobacter bucti TaxID=1844114 RepID=A0ABW4QQG5_9BACT
MQQPNRSATLATWLETAALPVITGVGVGLSSGLSMGGATGWLFGTAASLAAIAVGVALAERERRQTQAQPSPISPPGRPALPATSMTLSDLNALAPAARAEALGTCCGAVAWVAALNDQFPFASPAALFEAAERIWDNLGEADWREAFKHHPKIGDVNALKEKFASTATWAAGEQGAVRQAAPETLEALAAGNDTYAQKFGYIFIVCATGKSADEMLALLQARLPHEPAQEIHVARSEQAKITRLRLEKLLA